MKKTLLAIMMGVTILTSGATTTMAAEHTYTMVIPEDGGEFYYVDEDGNRVPTRVGSGKVTMEEYEAEQKADEEFYALSDDEQDAYYDANTDWAMGTGIWNNEPDAAWGCHVELNKETGKYDNWRVIEYTKPVQIYKEKSTSSTVIRKFDAGNCGVAMTSRKDCKVTGKWVKIKCGTGYGYLPNTKGTWKYRKYDFAKPIKSIVTCDTKMYKTYDGKKTICTVKQGSKVEWLGWSRYTYYAQIRYNGKVGYICRQNMCSSYDTEVDLFKGAYVEYKSVSVHNSLDKNSKVIKTLKYNTKVKVICMKESAAKIKVGNVTGWVNVETLMNAKNQCSMYKNTKEPEFLIDRIAKDKRGHIIERRYAVNGYNNIVGLKMNDIEHKEYCYITPSGETVCVDYYWKDRM